MRSSKTFFILLFLFSSFFSFAAKHTSFQPGSSWMDDSNVHINAHGGGILFYNGVYYWYGEHRPKDGYKTEIGVMCYSSTDLYNWKNEGVALTVSNEVGSPIEKGCIMERPKVIYNEKTKKFVMYVHLELKDRGYEAARVAIAIADSPTSEFMYIKSGRINAGYWPLNMTQIQRESKISTNDYPEWWTPEWRTQIEDGLFVRRDFAEGQMSRDMTLYVDENKKAYHIYSSEDNLTIQIAELTDDYLNYTGKYVRIEPGGHNEAPAIFKKNGKYFMITSGCTGWAPNEARLLVADNILGDWTLYPNPCVGKNANLTFNSQSTYILPIQGKRDAFIFMADRWKPQSLIESSYIWLPILFENDLPVLKWFDKWDLNIFDEINPDYVTPQKKVDGYKLAWNDEFNINGKLNTKIWNFENGFVRNNEEQWYQPENAVCKNGVLTITARKEIKTNPNYKEGRTDWQNRKKIEFTSGSINTRGKKEFKYGRVEVRAKIPTARGAWPAIWTLGNSMEWPSNGEIDIMEYYRINDIPHILANAAWGTDKRYNAKWNSSKIPFANFLNKDPHWADKFHIWRMDWDENSIRLYLDNELLNQIFLKDTFNDKLGNNKNPFHQPHYLLLNLALGGDNGGTIDSSAFPMIYEIDYVRVYNK